MAFSDSVLQPCEAARGPDKLRSQNREAERDYERSRSRQDDERDADEENGDPCDSDGPASNPFGHATPPALHRISQSFPHLPSYSRIWFAANEGDIRRLYWLDLPNPGQVPPPFKRSYQPDFHDFEGHFEGDEPLSQTKGVGVVMLARETRAFQGPA